MPTLPKCTCGNAENFIMREYHRSAGSFRIEDDKLLFRERYDTADLELDAVVCGECHAEVETEDFDIKD